MEGMATTTVNQNRLIEMRGSTGLKQSRKTKLPACQEERCHFGIIVVCREVEGAWFPSKKGSGREHNIKHPQDFNLLTSTTNMDDATRKLI
jgi:hypothetical protein